MTTPPTPRPRGRPKFYGFPRQQISVRLPKDLVTRLNAAVPSEVSRDEWIELAILEMLARMERDRQAETETERE